MLNPARALMRSRTDGGREFPKVGAFRDLYTLGWKPRYGEMTMVTGRSGSSKSTFGLYFAQASGLKTLYFSGDMSAFQASVKLACATHHTDIDSMVGLLEGEGCEGILAALPTNIDFAFGEITFAGINRMLDAYVELHNEYPDLIVVDNLMDIQGCLEYDGQMKAMQELHNLNREVGCAVWVMAHATDKGAMGRGTPHEPAPRSEIKNGMSEKPETILSLALNPHTSELNVAVVKSRLSKSDPSGRQFVAITSVPDQSRFVPHGHPVEGGSLVKPTGEEDAGADEREESQGGGAVRDGLREESPGEGIRRRAVKALW